MKLTIYTIYDSGISAHMQPFFMQSDGQAIRTFQDNVNSETQSTISKHPSDYTLFKIGTYDDNTAEIVCHTPVSLGNAKRFKIDQAPKISEADVKQLQENILQLTKQISLLPSPLLDEPRLVKK